MKNFSSSQWITRLTIAWGCSLTLSCTQSELLPLIDDSENRSIEISAVIGSLDTRAPQMDEVLGSGVFTDRDVIGLYVQKAGDVVYVCENKPYTLTGNVWGPTNGTDSLYWNAIGIDRPHLFSAHYPKQDIQTPANHPFTVLTDQNTGTNYAQSDLLFARTQAQGEAVQLRFTHLMSRLVLYVMTDSITSIKVKHLNRTGTSNMLTGTTAHPTKPASSDNTESDLVPRRWKEEYIATNGTVPAGTKSAYDLVVPSQLLTNTSANRLNFLEITTLAGHTLIAQAPLQIENTLGNQVSFGELTANMQTCMQIRLDDKKVEVGSASVMPWGVGGSQDLDSTRAYIGIATMQDLIDLSTYGTAPGYYERFVSEVDGIKAVRFLNDFFFDATTSGKFRGIPHLGCLIDGQGHTIRNLKGKPFLRGSDNVQNFYFEDCVYTGGNSSGFLYGSMVNGPLAKNCTFTNCHVGNASINHAVLCGHTNQISVENCWFYKCSAGAGSGCGIILGYGGMTHSRILNCGVVDCTVTGSYDIGALTGKSAARGGTNIVVNCYSINNTVRGNAGSAGLISGYMAANSISNCYAIGGNGCHTLFGNMGTSASNLYYAIGDSVVVYNGRPAYAHEFDPMTGELTAQPGVTLFDELNKNRGTNLEWHSYGYEYYDEKLGRMVGTSLPMFLRGYK